jgi:hypothetical protein
MKISTGNMKNVPRSHQKHGNEKEGCIISFFTKVCLRDEVISAIVAMVKGDMVAKELSTDWMMAESVMHQSLPK